MVWMNTILMLFFIVYKPKSLEDLITVDVVIIIIYDKDKEIIVSLNELYSLIMNQNSQKAK